MSAFILGVSVVVLATLLVTVGRWMGRKVKGWVMRDFVTAVESIVRGQIEPIEAQLVENGGLTLRDAVNRTEWRGARTEKRVKRIEDSMGLPDIDGDEMPPPTRRRAL